MNILFLPSWYPNDKSPFDGNFIQNHAKAISIFQDVTVLFCTSANLEFENFKITDTNTNQVREIIVYFNYHPFKFIRLCRKLNAYRMGLKLCVDYDVIHSHVFFMMGIFGIILAKLKSKKLVHTEHSSEFHKLSGWKFVLFHLLKNKISFYTPVSQDLNRTYIKYGVDKNKIESIPNTIDIDYFKILPKIKNHKVRYLHISAYQDPRKNIIGILKTFEKLSLVYTNIELEIGGDGDMNWLKTQLLLFDSIKDKLIINGKYNDAELIEAYNRANCFVLFSYFENFGMVLVESLCCGTPVIATKVGGVVDFINNSNGILVDPANELELYKAMESIILDNLSFEAIELRNSVLSYVSPADVAKRYDEIYKKLNPNELDLL